MKVTTTVAVPATTREEHHYLCSRCSAPCGPDEPSGTYEVQRATIKMQPRVSIESEDGNDFGYTSNIEKVVIDCCLGCFQEFAVPALKAAGFQPRTEELSR